MVAAIAVVALAGALRARGEGDTERR
jgi:hypothetical protein